MYLLPGETYTLKVDSGAFFNVKSDEEVKERSGLNLFGIAKVTSAERAFATQRYMVRVEPIKRILAITVNEKIRQAFADLGMENAEILEVQRGTGSTNVLAEAAAEVAPVVAPVSDFVLKIVKYLAGAIAAAALLYLLVTQVGRKE